tara:strand:+ start:371543 stop:371935 length:393 start_codon:yes stop_codon:yes gene_type:complete
MELTMSNLAEKTTDTTSAPTITLKEYQDWTVTTAMYPHAETGNVEELMYLALGLVGEAGEVANKVKKLFRDGDNQDLRTELAKELGDVMWYMGRLSSVLDVDLTETLAKNVAKLESRKARGVITGSGDNR